MRGSQAFEARHLSGLLFLLFGTGRRRLRSRLLAGFFPGCLLGRRLCSRLPGALRYRRRFFGFGSLLGLGFRSLGFRSFSFRSLGFRSLGFRSLGFRNLGFLSRGLLGLGLFGFGLNGLLGFDSLRGRCDLFGFDRFGFDRSLGFLSLRAFQSLLGF